MAKVKIKREEEPEGRRRPIQHSRLPKSAERITVAGREYIIVPKDDFEKWVGGRVFGATKEDGKKP
jgi:hypothetical protein